MKRTYIFAGLNVDSKIQRVRITISIPEGAEASAGKVAAAEALRQARLTKLSGMVLIHEDPRPELMLVLERGEIGGVYFRGAEIEPEIHVIDLDYETDDYVKAGDRIFGQITEGGFKRLTVIHENACADRDTPRA